MLSESAKLRKLSERYTKSSVQNTSPISRENDGFSAQTPAREKRRVSFPTAPVDEDSTFAIEKPVRGKRPHTDMQHVFGVASDLGRLVDDMPLFGWKTCWCASRVFCLSVGRMAGVDLPTGACANFLNECHMLFLLENGMLFEMRQRRRIARHDISEV